MRTSEKQDTQGNLNVRETTNTLLTVTYVPNIGSEQVTFQDGLYATCYQATLTVPEDFSEKVMFELNLKE